MIRTARHSESLAREMASVSPLRLATAKLKAKALETRPALETRSAWARPSELGSESAWPQPGVPAARTLHSKRIGRRSFVCPPLPDLLIHSIRTARRCYCHRRPLPGFSQLRIG